MENIREIENRRVMWNNSGLRFEVVVIREARPNLQNERMFRIQASPEQQYVVPMSELEL